MYWSGKIEFKKFIFQFFNGIRMGKVGWIVLVLIVIFAIFLVMGNTFTTSYTVLVPYKINKTAFKSEKYYGNFTVEKCAEKPDPEYWTEKEGYTQKAVEEGYVDSQGGFKIAVLVELEDGSVWPVGYMGPVIKSGCENITILNTSDVRYRQEQFEYEVIENRTETRYRPLFEEWGLTGLVINFQGLQFKL